MEIPFMKKETPSPAETTTDEWRKYALQVASENIPFAQGTMKKVVQEVQEKFGDLLGYDIIRAFLNRNGYKCHERKKTQAYMKNTMTTRKVRKQWHKDLIAEAEKMMPLYRGDGNILYEKITKKYPNSSYNSMMAVLVKNGIRTSDKTRPEGSKMQKQTNEFIGKVGNDFGATSYAIVKINGKKSIVSKPMPISNDEAMAIMEKRMF